MVITYYVDIELSIKNKIQLKQNLFINIFINIVLKGRPKSIKNFHN